MDTNIDWQQISQLIALKTNTSFTSPHIHPISGGCINSAYLLQNDSQRYFIKLNDARFIDMFKAEQSGLLEIAQTATIKVPQPILTGIVTGHSFLVLEYLDLTIRNQHSDAQLGQQLATLHKISNPHFGWHINNTIGSTPQINDPAEKWPAFWQSHRLNFQLILAIKNGFKGHFIQSGEKLANSLDAFFNPHLPHPSLLHGDLWSGNTAITQQGQPVLYDPACYYGDRETDIAMTELFGGFSHNFYAAYNETYPLDAAYSTRKTLYNLYHILNHLNLFGSSYQQQAQNMIDSLLSEIN